MVLVTENKLFRLGGCGDCGGGGDRNLLLLLLLLLLLNLLSLSRRARSLISRGLDALARVLLRTSFFPMSISQSKEPVTGFCASKFEMSLKTSSIGFMIISFGIGSSFCLKLTSFNLSFVM